MRNEPPPDFVLFVVYNLEIDILDKLDASLSRLVEFDGLD